MDENASKVRVRSASTRGASPGQARSSLDMAAFSFLKRLPPRVVDFVAIVTDVNNATRRRVLSVRR
ncbi:MAG: hypothetical protein AUH43_07685 [Acidobacteria bacterium 13_1_40CM_65_14]|nr:MAG: hypothetical protein AUH43_07685 [Acidobacteria bacterium 13_1_40CM_65_14]